MQADPEKRREANDGDSIHGGFIGDVGEHIHNVSPTQVLHDQEIDGVIEIGENLEFDSQPYTNDRQP